MLTRLYDSGSNKIGLAMKLTVVFYEKDNTFTHVSKIKCNDLTISLNSAFTLPKDELHQKLLQCNYI